MPSYKPVPAPTNIPDGVSPHIAHSIRRAELEAKQLAALRQATPLTPAQARRLKRRTTKREALSLARRQRISESPELFTRAEIIQRDNAICHLCGKTCQPHEIHIDHDQPLSRGGTHTRANVHVACAECNLRKGTMTTSEYLATLPTHSFQATRTNE